LKSHAPAVIKLCEKEDGYLTAHLPYKGWLICKASYLGEVWGRAQCAGNFPAWCMTIAIQGRVQAKGDLPLRLIIKKVHELLIGIPCIKYSFFSQPFLAGRVVNYYWPTL